jgi:hypothetical protein
LCVFNSKPILNFQTLFFYFPHSLNYIYKGLPKSNSLRHQYFLNEHHSLGLLPLIHPLSKILFILHLNLLILLPNFLHLLDSQIKKMQNLNFALNFLHHLYLTFFHPNSITVNVSLSLNPLFLLLIPYFFNIKIIFFFLSLSINFIKKYSSFEYYLLIDKLNKFLRAKKFFYSFKKNFFFSLKFLNYFFNSSKLFI